LQQTKLSFLRSLGPGIITACVVFGPGSLLVSANIGAEHRYELLWLMITTAVLMGAYMMMAMRISVTSAATPCTLIANHIGRFAAVIVGLNIFLICIVFQFANNLAVSVAVATLLPAVNSIWVLLFVNMLIIVFLFTAKSVYRILEFAMKVMVAVILICFIANLVVARPPVLAIMKYLLPHWPSDLPLAWPRKINGTVTDPLILVAALFGTTFSVAAAFYQGNLVREKGWSINQYRSGITDTIAGVAVLGLITTVIMITTATVIPGQTASDAGILANSLRPLLGPAAHNLFCVGLLAVALNPFMINAMVGGSILADGLGKAARLSDKWPRCLAALIMLTGMLPVGLIIIGQALTVIGNPLIAAALLWLANDKKIMGTWKNGFILNILGVAGLAVVVFMAARVLYKIILQLT
jgi:manganese transport protein